ncbi:molybdate ABC transporter substrate-binding protein [Kovacikia minuta CCNUW1]|uniref:molybdate ABC transporter substrate-binding protein n=1 Tax=Kovacikia minuta TaxID=2931930 RepID=UPI001CC91FD1|nr:molybdate ABC transporter substrate-binding protein [Kovacikia minuta]UBF28709.1 molybdate ABC transporter substrate-binding protein [Kovacikia minuta CCNUW1]
MKRQRFLVLITLLVLAFSLSFGMRSLNPLAAIAQSNTQLVVSAADSLTDALKELAPLYRQVRSNVTVRYNFASSGALQQQIENGAPADVFISAAAKQMDALQQKNLLVAGTRRNLLTNRLVLVVPRKTSGISNLKSLTDVRVKRIAIGDPRSVPAGQYAEEALTKAGLWNQLKPKYVLASNVRQVLQFVAAGNADAGLVYLTDAKTTDQVKIAQTIPSNLHSPIIYPIAVLKNSRNPTASRDFAQFLFSGTARKVFEKYGFTAT